VAAERAGFDGLSASDHLQPWWEPGESGHTARSQEMYEHGEREVSDEEFAAKVVAGSDPGQFADALREQLGASVITLQNNSSANADRVIEVLGGQVLPALRGARV